MTGKDIFDMALDLLGLRKEDGSYSEDTGDLYQRSLWLINILLAENSWIDYRIRLKEPDLIRIADMEEVIDCHPHILMSVIPYGLASLFLYGENTPIAREMNSRYEKARTEALKAGRAKAEAIREVYV